MVRKLFSGTQNHGAQSLERAWIVFAGLFLALFCCTTAFSDTIYVDCSYGGVVENGTLAEPYKTITNAVARLAVINAGSPGGHTISIAQGTYIENIDLTTDHSGVADSPNIFLGNGETIIRNETAGTYCFYLNLTQYITIRHLRIEATSVNNTTGVKFAGVGGGSYDYFFNMDDCFLTGHQYGLHMGFHFGKQTVYSNSVFVANKQGFYSAMSWGFRFTHCVFAFNETGDYTRYGGGLGIRAFRNCVFLSNSACDYQDSGHDDLDTSFTNCIFYKTGMAPWGTDYSIGSLEVMEESFPETGNLISADPCFVDAANFDFHNVYAGSPCLSDPSGHIGLDNMTEVPYPEQQTFYVNGGTGSDAYTVAQATNPATPWLTIGKALENAGVGDTVMVAEDTYEERITVTNAATGDRPLWVVADGDVVVDGDAYGLVFDKAANVIVDGVDITGFTDTGIRIASYAYGCVVRNSECHAVGATYGINIAGYADSGRNTVEHTKIYESTTGIRASNAYGMLFDSCDISAGNRGLYLGSYANHRLINCNFQGSVYGTYHWSYGHALFENCNFVSNSMAGVYVAQACTVRAKNCNLAFNGEYGLSMPSGQFGAENCNFYGNPTNMINRNTSTICQTAPEINGFNDAFTNNIVVDPMFRDVTGGDLRLRPDSPCVDAGTATNGIQFDYYGQKRLVGPALDIGVYEMPCGGSVFVFN